MKISPELMTKSLLIYLLMTLGVVGMYFFGSGPCGLQTDYYDTWDWNVRPARSRISPRLVVDAAELSGDFIKGGSFSIHYQGTILVPSRGRYRFSLQSSDDSWLMIDDQIIARTWGGQSLLHSSESIVLEPGWHAIEIAFFDQGGDYSMRLEWKKPVSSDYSAIPYYLLFPADVFTSSWFVRLFVSLVLFVIWLGAGIYVLKRYWTGSLGTAWSKVVTVMSLIICLGLLLFNLYTMFSHRQKAVHGCDTFGYLQAAIDMSEKGFTRTSLYDEAVPAVFRTFGPAVDSRELIFLQGPHAYYIDDFEQGKLVNQYPPGFPLLVSIVYALKGEAATYLINIFISLLLCFSLMGFFIHHGHWQAGCMVGLMGLFDGLMFEHSVTLMSDVPSAFLIFLACVLAHSAENRGLNSVVTGVLAGMAILVRYSNLLVVVPLLLLIMGKKAGRRFTSILSFTLSMVLTGIGPLLYYQNAVFGSPWRMSYAFTNTTKVSLLNVPHGLLFYGEFLLREYWGIFLVLSVIGFIVGLVAQKTRSISIVFGLFVVLHLVYISANAILLPRYLVPIIPVFLLFSGMALDRFLVWLDTWRFAYGVSFVLLLGFAAFNLHEAHGLPWAADRKAEEIPFRVGSLTEPDARILCDDLSGPLRLYGRRHGYRVLHVPFQHLRHSLEALLALKYPVYLAIDTKELWPLKIKLAGFFELEFLTDSPGVPLYRLRSMSSSGQSD